MLRPSGSPSDEYLDLIRAGITAGDWRRPYEWAKGWIGSGGGAHQLDPWLAYVASGLLKGEPRTAVHAIDLALKHWISDSADRAVLRWTRSRIVRFSLRDPRSALIDLLAADDDAPDWLAGTVRSDVEGCRFEAATTRKRKPAIGEAPDYVESGAPLATRSEADRLRAMPKLWPDIVPLLPSPGRDRS